MNTDTELDTWRKQWQARDDVPPDLRRSVERGTRHLRRGLVSEIAVTVVMGGGSAAWALLSQRVDALVLTTGIWVFIVIAWVRSMTLRRNLWKPVAETNAAFLDLSILRCRRGLQAITAQAALYVMILAFDLTWIYYYERRVETAVHDSWSFLISGGNLVVWGVTAALAVVAVLYRRRLCRELHNLLELRHQLQDQREFRERPSG